MAPIWHRFTPYSPSTTSAISQAPIYDDSSHGYRSEINEYNNYEPPGEDYFNKPADFSEFHDPWEDYLPETSTFAEYQPPKDHSTHYLWTNDESSSLRSEKYYDKNERNIDYSKEMNRDNDNRESGVSLGRNLNEEIYKDNGKEDYLISFDDVSSKESVTDFSGYNQFSDDQNYHYVSNKNDQAVNELVVVYRTTENDYSTMNYDRNEDRGENFQLINDQSNNRSLKNFITTHEGFFVDNRKPAAREEYSDISLSLNRSHELTSTAHPTPMHDLVQHNEQTVENQGHIAIDADVSNCCPNKFLVFYFFFYFFFFINSL